MKREEVSGEVRRELPGLSRRVRARREELKMTQETLAAAAGVSREHINRVENGHNRTPHTVDRLADALDVHPLWLTTGLDCYATHLKDSAAQYLSGAGLAAAGNLPDDPPKVSGKLAADVDRARLSRWLHFGLGLVLGGALVAAWAL